MIFCYIFCFDDAQKKYHESKPRTIQSEKYGADSKTTVKNLSLGRLLLGNKTSARNNQCRRQSHRTQKAITRHFCTL